MTLAQQLDDIRAAGAKRIPEDKRAIMGAATKELIASDIMSGVIKVGDPLPDFSLPNSAGVNVQSADLLKKGAVVLTVFRGAW